MAMIHCPECGQEISDKAKKCIHCGKALVEEAKQKSFVLNVVMSFRRLSKNVHFVVVLWNWASLKILQLHSYQKGN